MGRSASIAAIVFVAVLATVPASGAGAAGPPGSASGSYQIPAATDDLTGPVVVGGNLVFQEVAPLIYTGGLTGSSLDIDTFVVHANGTFEGHGVETCDHCMIGGRTGSYAAEFTFVGSGDDYTGQLTFLRGGGGLAGLHGGGFFAGTESGTGGTYSYHYLFGS